MPKSCRDVISTFLEHFPNGRNRPSEVKYPKHATHAGLLLSRYLTQSVKDNNESADNHARARKALLEAAVGATRHGHTYAIYDAAFKRWHLEMSKDPTAATDTVTTTSGRMVTGLGEQSVLEIGITLHHTYGVPIIRGSALKGLAAHYCDQVWGEADLTFRGPRRKTDGKGIDRPGDAYATLFGRTDDAGFLIFHDAWIKPDSLQKSQLGLLRDVMTPHHSDYYGSEGNKTAPTDFDDPNPVSFLSIRGEFLLAVTTDPAAQEKKGGDSRQLANIGLSLLEEALTNWGIGAKTSSGYGRFDSAQSGDSE